MFFQQELWLIIVGLIVAKVVQKTNQSPVAYKSIALWSCLFSLIVGELGMLTQLFFPSDPLGLAVTALAALIAAKVVIGSRTGANQAGKSHKTIKTDINNEVIEDFKNSLVNIVKYTFEYPIVQNLCLDNLFLYLKLMINKEISDILINKNIKSYRTVADLLLNMKWDVNLIRTS